MNFNVERKTLLLEIYKPFRRKSSGSRATQKVSDLPQNTQFIKEKKLINCFHQNKTFVLQNLLRWQKDSRRHER